MLQLARILTFIVALGIVALGFLGGCVGLLIGALGPAADRLTMMTASVSLIALTNGLGLPLAWESWQSLQRRASGVFHPRRIWPWIALYVLALGAGQLVLYVGLDALFPPFHLLAAAVPPVLLVILVERGLQARLHRRSLVLQGSSGAFLSTTLALTLEGAFVIGLLVAVFVAVGLQPGGMEQLQTLADRLQDPAWVEDPFSQASLTLSPVLIVAALAVMAGIIPLIEEAVKALGVPLLAYQQPGRAEAFLWGVVGGAGFALAENLFNALGGLDLWAPVAASRIGATLLHGFTGGMMGLAWYYLLVERRWFSAGGLYVVSVVVHAAWNALAVGLALISLAGADSAALAGLGSLGLMTLLGLLALAVA
ncbi:MAG: PrsW family glutamic-type intramembrane protease, partial [Anaerolineae bacterium]